MRVDDTAGDICQALLSDLQEQLETRPGEPDQKRQL
jgi:hypothetical protein